MNQIIKKGTTVRIRTTNGGDTTVKLLEDYRPTYSFYVETSYGHTFFVDAGRLRSIDVVINYWTAPLTATEVADTLGHVAMRRAVAA